MRRRTKWLLAIAGGFVLIIVIAIAAGGSSDSTDSGDQTSTSSTSTSSESSDPEPTPESCGTRATDDCTPRVKEGRTVRVDALYWTVDRTARADHIGGEDEFSDPTNPDGVFVIVDLTVRSAKSGTETLTDDPVKLVAASGDKELTYDADLDGMTALSFEGGKALTLETLSPGSSKHVQVVYDVPAATLKRPLAMRFNELGLGSTHAYIELEPITA